MPKKKQQFRFRIPWISGAPAPRPATDPQSRRPKQRSKPPSQLDTNVPIQRPPFRPPGIAPAQPPPTQPQGTPRAYAEPQQQSPSRPPQPSTSSVNIESPVNSQSKSPSPSSTNSPLPSPSRTTQTQNSSQSPSPSHADSPSPSHLPSGRSIEVPKPAAEESTRPASSVSEQEKEKMVPSEPMPPELELKVKSPLKTIPKSPETSSQADRMITQPTGSESRVSYVPSSFISKTQGAAQPQSPSHLASERTSEVLKPTAEESTLPASSASQQEKGKVADPLSQESEPKMKSPLKIIPKSVETPSQAEKISSQPKGILRDEERSTTPNKTKELELDSASATGTSKATLETQSKSHQSKEKEKVVHEPIEVGKGNDTKNGQGQPIRKTKAELHRTTAFASGVQTKDPFTRVFRADKKRQEARETMERKMMFATSSPSGKDIKVVSSVDPVTRNVSTISLEKPVLSNGEKAPLQKGIKDHISKFVHKLATVNPTQPMDDKPVSVVTLAGDNRGATMHVGSQSAKKEGSIHIHRAYKTDPEESTEVTSDAEENSKKWPNNSMEKDEMGKAYVNSNIQSINNSLMLHGSITERDPGVNVILPQQPGEPIKRDDKRGFETRKPEVNISRAQKLTYQPMIRKRCLRGLFLEPSDSDPDNPDKPRRHGCKFSCGEIRKDKDEDFVTK